MPTSSRFAVAVHVLVALALQEGRPLTSEQLASSVRADASVVRRLLSQLARAGLTAAQFGAGGGARLARAPGAITLLDVHRAVQERGLPLFPVHRTPPDPECIVGRNVLPVLAGATERAERALEAELTQTTIRDVSDGVLSRAKTHGGRLTLA